VATCRQRLRRIIDRTLPVVYVAHGRRLMASIQALYGDRLKHRNGSAPGLANTALRSMLVGTRPWEQKFSAN
jgi:hypothetical protein